MIGGVMEVGPFNANLETLTSEQIEDILLQLDVGGRFDGDIEYLHLVQKESRTVEEIERMRQLLRESGVRLGFRL
jgi:hypothetical protein